MVSKDFHNSDKVYQKGDRVCCIGGGLHIECVNYKSYIFSFIRLIFFNKSSS